jgi:hypothetical protein
LREKIGVRTRSKVSTNVKLRTLVLVWKCGALRILSMETILGILLWLGMVVHACNPNSGEAEAERS